VAERIAQGFLGDAVKVHGDLRVFDPDASTRLERGEVCRSWLVIATNSSRAAGQPLGIHLHGENPAGDAAGLDDGILSIF